MAKKKSQGSRAKKAAKQVAKKSLGGWARLVDRFSSQGFKTPDEPKRRPDKVLKRRIE